MPPALRYEDIPEDRRKWAMDRMDKLQAEYGLDLFETSVELDRQHAAGTIDHEDARAYRIFITGMREMFHGVSN
jgi:hypothetical protein